MAIIPAGTKFIGIGASVPTPENKSSQNNGFQEVYTIEDIIADAAADSEVVDDLTPQLGGDLDVNGKSIISVSNGDINITPNGTGVVKLDGLTYPSTDGVNGQFMQTNGSGVISFATVNTGLTIGTTAITSGTVGRILFQGAGNVVQQDSDLFWNNTNKRLGVGATPSTSVRLDVRAQGALSTDIAFRVRNSGDTVNTFAIQGDGNILQLINSTGAFTLQKGFNIGATNDSSVFQAYMSNSSGANRAGFLAQTSGAGYSYLFHDYGSSGGGGSTSGNLFHNTGAGAAYFNFASIGGNSNGFRFIRNTGTTINNTEGKLFQVASSSVTWYQSVISIGTYCGASQSSTPTSAYGGNTLFIANGTAPTTTDTDSFGMYSADIVAGNAAPHFRTENGAVIKLYQQSSAGIATVADLVTILQNVGLLS